MKKYTDMDYEKEYNEVFKRAKELHEAGNALTKKQMEIVFPQLAEGEDERIRRELIEYLRGDLDDITTDDTDRWITWIEKQKAKEDYDRMMPVYNDQDSFESALEKAWKSYNDSGARMVDSCEDDYVECAHAKGFREGFLYGIEKQKEQLDKVSNKTIMLNGIAYKEGEDARFSGCEFCDVRIKDPQLFNNMCLSEKEKPCNGRRYLKTVCDDLEKAAESYRRKTCNEACRNGFLNDNPSPSIKAAFIAGAEFQKEHQNNNSSAPNESSWAGNISSSHKDKNLDEIAQDYVDGVKEYNPEPTWDLMQTAVCYGYHYCEQKEQKPATPDEISAAYQLGLKAGRDERKPAEWSEEDEDNLHRVIRVLEDNDSDWKELSDWLKSLRPHWKPSEEQMEALQKAAYSLNGTGTETDVWLVSLYSDLKKLQED